MVFLPCPAVLLPCIPSPETGRGGAPLTSSRAFDEAKTFSWPRTREAVTPRTSRTCCTMPKGPQRVLPLAVMLAVVEAAIFVLAADVECTAAEVVLLVALDADVAAVPCRSAVDGCCRAWSAPTANSFSMEWENPVGRLAAPAAAVPTAEVRDDRDAFDDCVFKLSAPNSPCPVPAAAAAAFAATHGRCAY